jgi:hypothetical protein
MGSAEKSRPERFVCCSIGCCSLCSSLGLYLQMSLVENAVPAQPPGNVDMRTT